MTWQEIHHIDQLLTLEINSWHSFITDPIWAFFSDKFVWAPMYAAIIGLLIWKLGWKRGLIVLAAALLTFGFCDQFSNLVKHAVCRIRPLHDDFMVSHGLNILEQGGGYSFFSAHAANAFGLAFSTFTGMKLCLKTCPKWLKTYGGWMFFWAFMVAVSRIFVGKHFLGDVIVGSIVGIVAGVSFGLIARYFIKKYL
jgi:undecaprenyl-diphosphatase